MEFYKILQEIMDEQNVSIPDVARKANLADSTVRSIVNRKSKSVALDVALKISIGLGVSIERLNGIENLISVPKQISPFSADTLEVANAYQALANDDQRTIVRRSLGLPDLKKGGTTNAKNEVEKGEKTAS